MTTSRVYLSPGMFGFARLAAYDYFDHTVRAVDRRFRRMFDLPGWLAGALMIPLAEWRIGIKADTISQLVDFLFSIVLQVGVPIAVIMLIYSGFLFVTARGNPEQITTARRAFMWTVIGTAVLLGASVLAGVIQGTIDQIKS